MVVSAAALLSAVASVAHAADPAGAAGTAPFPEVPAPPTRDATDGDEPLPPPPAVAPEPPRFRPPDAAAGPRAEGLPAPSGPAAGVRGPESGYGSPEATAPPRPSDAPPLPRRMKRRSYGYQTLLSDVFAGLLLAAGHGDDTVYAVGLGIYLGGGPLIHALHGHEGKAVGSLALRGAGPLLIVAGSQSTGTSSDDDVGLIALGVLAIPAAVVLDAAALAREEVPDDTESAHLRVSPFVLPHGSGAGLSIGGEL